MSLEHGDGVAIRTIMTWLHGVGCRRDALLVVRSDFMHPPQLAQNPSSYNISSFLLFQLLSFCRESLFIEYTIILSHFGLHVSILMLNSLNRLVNQVVCPCGSPCSLSAIAGDLLHGSSEGCVGKRRLKAASD